MRDFFVATVVLDLAAFATGIFLCWIGKGLLEKGISGGFRGEGEIASNRFKVVTSSPGLVFALAGLIVISTAIVEQSKLDLGPGPAAGSSQEGADLGDLAGLARRVSMLHGESSTDWLDMSGEDRLEHARRYASAGDDVTAGLLLVEAIVLEPHLLDLALKADELERALQQPAVAGVIRHRFELPLSVPEELSSSRQAEAARALAARLRLNAQVRRTRGIEPRETASLRARVPTEAGAEPIGTTMGTLAEIMDGDPSAMAEMLEAHEYRWLSNRAAVMRSLSEQLDRAREGTSGSEPVNDT